MQWPDASSQRPVELHCVQPDWYRPAAGYSMEEKSERLDLRAEKRVPHLDHQEGIPPASRALNRSFTTIPRAKRPQRNQYLSMQPFSHAPQVHLRLVLLCENIVSYGTQEILAESAQTRVEGAIRRLARWRAAGWENLPLSGSPRS